MTQHEQLVDLFKRNDNRVRLGQIMQTTLAAEYRARMTDLRKKGYVFLLERGKQPSDNLYIMTEPEIDGQMRFA